MEAPVPAFSVITVVLNAAEHLQDCLRSVASQEGVALEHIVIDGGSTDGSLELLRHAEHRLAHLESGPDSGIADAMNKGVAKARGEWLLFLHADDFLAAPDALAQASKALGDDFDVAVFPILFGAPPATRRRDPRPVGWWFNFKMGMSHQGCLMRRRLFDGVGAYDCGYRLNMDYDLLMRAHRAGLEIRAFREPVLAVMRDSGISSRRDWPSLSQRLDEERKVHMAHAPRWMRIPYRAYWALYKPYRRFASALSAD